MYLVIGGALGLAGLQDDKLLLLVEIGNLGYHGSCTVVAKLGCEREERKKGKTQDQFLFKNLQQY
jgi:hypothetical protein